MNQHNYYPAAATTTTTATTATAATATSGKLSTSIRQGRSPAFCRMAEGFLRLRMQHWAHSGRSGASYLTVKPGLRFLRCCKHSATKRFE